jgi:hypothetical protein
MPLMYDMGPTALLPFRRKGSKAEDFFRPEKNPMVSAAFEPANLGSKGRDATSRPPKPLCSSLVIPTFLFFLSDFQHTYSLCVLTDTSLD